MHSRILSVLLGLALGLAILGPGAWGFSTTPGTDDAAGGARAFIGANTKKLLCSQTPGFTLNLPYTSGAGVDPCSKISIVPSDLGTATPGTPGAVMLAIGAGTGNVWLMSPLEMAGQIKITTPTNVGYSLGLIGTGTNPSQHFMYANNAGGLTFVACDSTGNNCFREGVFLPGGGAAFGTSANNTGGGAALRVTATNPFGVPAFPGVSIGAAGVDATAALMVGAGSRIPGQGQMKLVPGYLLATPEDGAIEYDGSHLYATRGRSRVVIDGTAMPEPYGYAQSTATITGTGSGIATASTTSTTTATMTVTATLTGTGSTTASATGSVSGTATATVTASGTYVATATLTGTGAGTAIASATALIVGIAEAENTITCIGIPCSGVPASATGTATVTSSGTGTYRPLAATGMTIDGSGLVPKSQPIAAVGKFYFVTGSGTATATTTAVTSLGNVTGMGCLP